MAESVESNARLVVRINRALRLGVQGEDARVLHYVKDQITPKGMDKRGDEDQDVTHLHQVAKGILNRFERGSEDASSDQ